MTLVELLVAMVVGSVVGGLILSMFITSNQTFTDQGRIVGVQRSGRLAMETMTRLLREAGLDPLGSADAGITAATASSISFTRDTNVNGVIDAANIETVEFEYSGNVLRRRFDGGAWIVLAEKVKAFELKYYDADNGDPLAFDNAGIPLPAPAEVTIGPIPAAALARIRAIVMRIELEEDQAGGGDFVRSYTTGIYCRNL